MPNVKLKVLSSVHMERLEEAVNKFRGGSVEVVKTTYSVVGDKLDCKYIAFIDYVDLTPVPQTSRTFYHDGIYYRCDGQGVIMP